jgi:hypothetical protein
MRVAFQKKPIFTVGSEDIAVLGALLVFSSLSLAVIVMIY